MIRYGKWWYLRRGTALGVLALFLLPRFGGPAWLVGDYSGSTLLGKVPLADPVAVLQSFLATHEVAAPALIGAGLITFFYILLGGRTFCAWICPLGLFADLARWLSNRLGIKRPFRGLQPPANVMFLAAILLAALVSGAAVWEFYDPVALFGRSLIFAGSGIGVMSGLIVLLFFVHEFAVSRTGWCRGICPTGAFYGLLGRFSPLGLRYDPDKGEVAHTVGLCPEPEALAETLMGKKPTGACTLCGACIDNDRQGALSFGLRKTEKEGK